MIKNWSRLEKKFNKEREEKEREKEARRREREEIAKIRARLNLEGEETIPLSPNLSPNGESEGIKPDVPKTSRPSFGPVNEKRAREVFSFQEKVSEEGPLATQGFDVWHLRYMDVHAPEQADTWRIAHGHSVKHKVESDGVLPKKVRETYTVRPPNEKRREWREGES